MVRPLNLFRVQLFCISASPVPAHLSIYSIALPYQTSATLRRFPPLVIQLGAFMLSAAWGLGLYAATYFALKHSRAGHQVRLLVVSFYWKPC